MGESGKLPAVESIARDVNAPVALRLVKGPVLPS